jgi:hypothetical protein
MTSPTVPPNAYTDAPELHPNLILGSLQVLFWLFFHPSAWRNHVARVDPALRPDFTPAELSGAQWHNPSLQRLLMTAYLVWPLPAGLLVGLELWALGASGQSIVFKAVPAVVEIVVMSSFVASVAAGVASGIAGGIAVGVAAGLACGVAFSTVGSVTVGVANSMAGGVAIYMASGVAIGMAFGVAISVGSRRPTYSLARQMGSAVVGALIGGAAVSVAFVVGFSVAVSVGWGIAFSVVIGVGSGVVASMAIGIVVGWRTRSWRRGVAAGLAVGVAVGVIGIIVVWIGMKSDRGGDAMVVLAFCALYNALFGFPYVLSERIAGPWAGVVAGTLGSVGGGVAILNIVDTTPLWPMLPLNLISILLGLTLAGWRPVLLYPLLAAWNLVLYRADERRSSGHPTLLRWHSAFWDEHQRLSLFGLEDYLVLVAERNSAEGQAAIEYLATSRQRWAAQAAQIELDARRLEGCADVMTIGNAHRGLAAGELTGPASALLRSFSRLSQDVDAALRQESSYNQRLALSAVEDRLDSLLRELTRSSERYAARFRPIAARFRQTVANYVRELAEAVEARQEIDNPYVIGVPLTEQQEIFVGRIDVSARIEGLLLDRRRPPLLLYGQRRMGKTSLLNNLGRLLPSTIVPFFVDLQGPATQASDHAGFLYNVARGMIDSAERQRNLALPPLPREALATDPLTRFDEWLDEIEEALGGNAMLLALDEFETLDRVLTEGRFSETAVLGMLRHLIQHRPRFKVLLAGSHTLDELQRWASYLINVQVVHISYLKEDKARQLIERPVKDFALRYESDANQRVLDLTRGHPFLVQLLCAEIVALKNEQDPAIRRLARLADVEAAVPEALSHGSFFFADIQQNQVDAAGLALLRFLAAQGEGAVVSREALARQFPAELDRTLDLLTRRELIEPADGGYRFQVELIRRWFAQR